MYVQNGMVTTRGEQEAVKGDQLPEILLTKRVGMCTRKNNHQTFLRGKNYFHVLSQFPQFSTTALYDKQ